MKREALLLGALLAILPVSPEARALEAAGMYDRMADGVLNRWRSMIDLHLSTWAEYLPGRSDCHAWSSWPAYDFMTRVLGIRPAKPGFAEILIRPHAAGLTWAKGGMDTPVGRVIVNWEVGAGGVMEITVDAPVGVTTIVELPDGESQEFREGGSITL